MTGAAERTGNEPMMVNTIMALAKRTRAYVGIRLKEVGLAIGQDELLVSLDEHDGATVSALAELIFVRPSTVSKMLDRLAAKGLVRRDRPEGDQRRTVVYMTPEGREMVRQVHRIYTEIDLDLQRVDEAFADPDLRRTVEMLGDAVHKRLIRIR